VAGKQNERNNGGRRRRGGERRGHEKTWQAEKTDAPSLKVTRGGQGGGEEVFALKKSE